MAKYEIQKTVMRWKQGDVLTSEELVFEGISSIQWVNNGLLKELPENPIPQELKSLDVNKDGVLDDKDAKIASQVLNTVKSQKKVEKKKGGR